MDTVSLGSRIREIRESHGLTQEELASKTGISIKHLSVLERGLKEPRLSTFLSIAEALGTTPNELLTSPSLDNEFISAIGSLQRLQVLLEYLFPGHRIDERNLHSSQLDVGRDKIDVLGMMQNSFTWLNLLILYNTAHGCRQRKGQFVRLGEAQRDRERALGVRIHQQDALTLLGKTYAKIGTGGCLPDTTFLIGNCYYLGFVTYGLHLLKYAHRKMGKK